MEKSEKEKSEKSEKSLEESRRRVRAMLQDTMEELGCCRVRVGGEIVEQFGGATRADCIAAAAEFGGVPLFRAGSC